MRKINEELIGKDSVKKQENEIEVKTFVTDEPEAAHSEGFDGFSPQVEHPDEYGATQPKPQAAQPKGSQSEQTISEVAEPREDRSGASSPQADFQPEEKEPQNLSSNEAEGWMENLEFILDIPLQIDIQLGQTKMPLREVLFLSSGSIIKLNKSESDPVELLINGKLVAEGQIVLTDGNTLGIQVTSIVNRVERIRSLR